MPDGIQQLSTAMAAGDPDAVAAFYRDYFDWMFIQARLATRRDEAFCLDVVQDSVLRVMRSVRCVDCETRFRAWLRLVVQTTALDLLRSERRRTARESSVAIGETTEDRPGMAGDAEQLLWLSRQIEQLDPQLVKIIELRFERRWTLRKIGQRLGLSSGAVDGRLKRALKRLRETHGSASSDDGAMHDDGM